MAPGIAITRMELGSAELRGAAARSDDADRAISIGSCLTTAAG